jgi:hypothetical protein
MKKLKVWGGSYPRTVEGIRSPRCLVAAYTKKQAAEISGLTIRELSDYYSETGNLQELALANEVGVWITQPWKVEVIKRLI